MSRVAIIGSCISRDLWPIQGEAPDNLLYISRTSLPSLFAPPVTGVILADHPPNGLARHQHAAVVADLRKTALAALVAHRPTHILLDFIDERFDLLAVGDTLATHSWELETSGYMTQPALAGARSSPRLSPGCENVWMAAAAEFASFIASTPLRSARLILHEAQWADRYTDLAGAQRPMPRDQFIWDGRPADPAEHNALLRRYQAALLEAAPWAIAVGAGAYRIADEGHRWGLTPFHYVEDYYREIRRRLAELGI